jgi:hypothetical protein
MTSTNARSPETKARQLRETHKKGSEMKRTWSQECEASILPARSGVS